MRQRLHVELPDVGHRHGGLAPPRGGRSPRRLGELRGQSAYEVQRMVGGTAHDDAFTAATKEGMQRFHQCSRCGKWVCPEVCWNAQVGQCEECAPNFKEEFASAHAHAKVDAARQQLQEKRKPRTTSGART